MSGASAAQRAIRASRSGETEVISLQELHADGAPVFDRERSAAN
jgi:hypothetical protein